MRAARFFLDEPLATAKTIALPERVAHHALRVLRLRDRDPIVLFNGTGGEFAAQLSVNGSHAYATIDTFVPVERETSLRIRLIQSWVAADKLEWIIEKSVELGVDSIRLAPAQRSVIRVSGERMDKRIDRLRDLIVAACAQCGRNRIPSIEASPTLAASLEACRGDHVHGAVLHPGAELPLMAAASKNNIVLAVGPEGGFDDEELALARRLGYPAYHLGPRVLRTETAAPAALAALQAIAGDFS